MPRLVALCGLFLAASLAVLFIVEMNRALTRWQRFLLTGLFVSAYALILYFRPDPPLVGGLVGLIAAGLIGTRFGSSFVGTPHGLLAFLMTASVVDLVSVASGPTKILADAAADGTSNLILYLAILLPWEGRLIPALGVGDIFGLAVLFASLRHQEFGRVSTFACGFVGILLALFVGLARGGTAGYPFLAAAAVVALAIRRWFRDGNA